MVEINEYNGLMSTLVIIYRVVCVYLHLRRSFFSTATGLPLGPSHIQITSGVTRSLSSWMINLISLHRVFHEFEFFFSVLMCVSLRMIQFCFVPYFKSLMERSSVRNKPTFIKTCTCNKFKSRLLACIKCVNETMSGLEHYGRISHAVSVIF